MTTSCHCRIIIRYVVKISFVNLASSISRDQRGRTVPYTKERKEDNVNVEIVLEDGDLNEKEVRKPSLKGILLRRNA